MRNALILSFKGLIIGFGKIIPGVSGSLLAIILNVYEECLERISYLFKNFKDNLYYLVFLGIGVIIAIVFGSRMLVYLFNHHYFYTMCTILGLMTGVLPGLLKKTKFKAKKDIFLFILPFIFIYLLEFLNGSKQFIPTTNFISYLIIVLIGFIEALTTIIPGISGTATFMILGFYDFVLKLFSNPFTIYLPFYIIGVLIGIIFISRLMTYLFKYHHDEIYLVIVSLTLGSLFFLFKDVLSINFTLSSLFVGIVLFVIGYIASYFLNK